MILSLFFASALAAVDCPQSKTTYSCVKYLHNYDGDTVTIVTNGENKRLRIRVLGIDTPEIVGKGKGTPCQYDKGQKARTFVHEELKKASKINVTGITGPDKYGRVLGKITYDGKALDQELITRGLAMIYRYPRPKNIDWCKVTGN